MEFYSFWGATAILCIFVGVPANLTSFFLFLRSTMRHKINKIIYCSLAFTDASLCFTMLPEIVSGLSNNRYQLQDHPNLCKFNDFVMEIAMRYSLFLIMLLGILRTQNILSPMKHQSLALVGAILAIYLAVQVIQTFIPVLVYLTGDYEDAQLCDFRIDKHPDVSATVQNIWKIVTICLETTLPIFVLVFTSIVTIAHLLKMGINVESDKTKKQASITVFILTIVCVCFTLPAIIKTFLIFVGYDNHEGVVPGQIVNCLLYLNSVANPLVYLLRMVKVRRVIRRLRGERIGFDVQTEIVSSGRWSKRRYKSMIVRSGRDKERPVKRQYSSVIGVRTKRMPTQSELLKTTDV